MDLRMVAGPGGFEELVSVAPPDIGALKRLHQLVEWVGDEWKAHSQRTSVWVQGFCWRCQ
jgi:hypothetical protein